MTHPAVTEAREVIALEEHARHQAAARLRAALLLSPTLDIFEAFLRGETIPLSQLDQDWLRRLKVRRAA